MTVVVNNQPPIINNPQNNEDYIGLLLFIFAFIVFMVFLFYGLPVIRQALYAPKVNIPSKIDINVNK